MKSASKLIIVLLTFLTLATSAYAQSLPLREQLSQLVEQLQKTPTDNALRERIIKLATSIKPAPAIPEEAREPFVMGATVLKKASDPAGAGKAVDLFTQALTIAPWFAEAYYNRALARETAGQFEPAIDDLKLYLEFKLTDAERREAQDKIYSLKADAQLAVSKNANDQTTKDRKAFEGHWIQFTTRKYSDGMEASLSQAMSKFDISFDDNGEAKVISLFSQFNAGRWLDSTPEEFRGRLVNGDLVVNPIELSQDDRKRELRFRRTQQGLIYKATIIGSRGGGEWTMEFNVRR
jgi:tetratricopeptide (TPR) repeat protein